MIRAETVIARGDWTGRPADTVVLDYDDRHRRRITMQGVGGLSFLLDLPEAVALRSGDAIRLAAHVGDRQGRGGHEIEGIARRQIKQHLLAVVGIDDDDLARRLADRRRRRLAFGHLNAALRVAEFDQTLEHGQRGLGALDRHGPVGPADRGGRRDTG